MKDDKVNVCLLQLFAEGGAEGAGQAPADPAQVTAGTGEAAPEQPPQTPEQPREEAPEVSQAERFILDQVQRWHSQADRAREVYPGLDLAAELRDPRFCQLLRSGVDVESAYTLVHREQILTSAMHHAARVARQQLSSAIASGAVRPPENGLAAGSGAVSVGDVSRLTRQQRDDIRKRAARGEKIRL